jgi:hypothetical protein
MQSWARGATRGSGRPAAPPWRRRTGRRRGPQWPDPVDLLLEQRPVVPTEALARHLFDFGGKIERVRAILRNRRGG